MSRLMIIGAIVLVTSSAFTSVAGAGQPKPPAVFNKQPYAEAKKAAEDGKKWFIVKATATWCAPCKQMDKTTWVDDKVIKWINTNAIAVALDVDAQPAIAKSLSVEAMPTMIAFKNGKEFDRVVGYKSGADLLAWLEGVARGEKSIEAVQQRAKPAGDGKIDTQARMQVAQSLAQSGQFEKAAEEFVWLWQHMLEHDPAMTGVRLSFMANDMQALAKKSPVAKAKFTELRDQTGELLKKPKVSGTDLSDWLILNTIIEDQKATLDWFDGVKNQAKWTPLLTRQARILTPLLIEQSRWADIALLYPDPIAHIEQEFEFQKMIPKHEAPEGLDEQTRKMIEEMPMSSFRKTSANLYASLLTAPREKEANALADRARVLDKSTAMTQALISTALNAGQPRAAQLEWLSSPEQPAAKKDTSDAAAIKALRSRLESALKASEKDIPKPK